MAPEPHYIDVDLKRNTQLKVFAVTQNDTDVAFIVRVTDNGLASDTLLDSFTTVTLTSVRPKDKKAFYVAGEKAAGTNEISFKLGTSELANVGKVEASIQLYGADGRMSTAHFTYEVRKDHTGEYVPSENEASLIETVLVDGPRIMTEAEAATLAAETATTNLETDKAAALAEMSTATAGANTAAETADSERVRMVNEVTQVVTDVDGVMTYIQDDFLPNTALALSDMDLVVQENTTVANAAKTTAEDVEAQFNQIVTSGPVQSVNGQTGIVSGLALQSDLNQTNATLAETETEIRERVYTKSTTSIKPLVSFYLDDGYQQDYTVVYPKAKTLGIPLTVCLHDDSWFTVNPTKLNEVVADGWEVHAHTVLDQDLRNLTYEQQFQTMKQNKDLLESLGHKVEGLCYPRGFSNADTLKATRALFKVGMSSVQSANSVPIDTYYIKRILTDSYDMAEMKAMVDSAIASGKGWLIFYSHSNIYETNTAVRDRYFEIMDYVAAANIETATVGEALKTYANTLDIGDVAYSKDFMKIGADGSIDSTILPVIYGTGNTAANAKSGTAYKSGRITVDKFMATSPSDIPIDNGVGILHTDRLFEDYKYAGSRALQRFDGINGTTALRTFNGSWSDWTVTGNFNTRKTKAYTAASPITDYPAGKVTKVTFISGEAADLPEGGIGTLETTRLSANDLLNYQIFHPYNKTIFYKRVWINGAWSTFRRFSTVIFHAATHDFGVVNAGSTVSPTFTVNDVVIGDVVNVNFEYGVANGVIPFAYISAANTITVKLTNVTAANVTVGSRPLKFVVNKA